MAIWRGTSLKTIRCFAYSPFVGKLATQRHDDRSGRLRRARLCQGDGNTALQEFLKCTMASTGNTITPFGAEIKRYQNLMIDLGMPQDEEKMVVAQYLKGMPLALKDVRSEVERMMRDGNLEKKIDAVMREAESFAITKDLLELVQGEAPEQPKRVFSYPWRKIESSEA